MSTPSGSSSTNASAWASSRALRDAVVGRASRPSVDVVADRLGEQERLLEHEAAHAGLDGHRAGVGGQQAVDAPQQRGLAGAGGPDDGHRRPLGDRRGRRRCSTSRPCSYEKRTPRAATPVPARRDGRRRRRGAGRCRLGQDASDAVPPGQRAGQVAEHEADEPQRPHQQREQVDEAGDVADRGRAGLHPVGADHDEQDVGQVGHGVEQRPRTWPAGGATMHLGARAARPPWPRGGPTRGASAPSALTTMTPVEALVDQLGDLADAVLGLVGRHVDAALVVDVHADQQREQQHGHAARARGRWRAATTVDDHDQQHDAERVRAAAPAPRWRPRRRRRRGPPARRCRGRCATPAAGPGTGRPPLRCMVACTRHWPVAANERRNTTPDRPDDADGDDERRRRPPRWRRRRWPSSKRGTMTLSVTHRTAHADATVASAKTAAPLTAMANVPGCMPSSARSIRTPRRSVRRGASRGAGSRGHGTVLPGKVTVGSMYGFRAYLVVT